MLKLLLLLFFLVSACVAIHGVGTIMGLRWFNGILRKHMNHPGTVAMFWILIRIVYGLLMLHVLQILVWAAFYHISGCFPDFETCFYYSATSYATVGYGDVVPAHGWRIMGSMEGVTGILMFGWSTGVLFSVVSHLYGRLKAVSHDHTTTH